jgi:hypothetical protein
MRKKLPLQPVIWDGKGVIRFQKNAVVNTLFELAAAKGVDLNLLHIAAATAPAADWDQFNQLIGYSVSGCPLRTIRAKYFAERRAKELLNKYPEDPAKKEDPHGS